MDGSSETDGSNPGQKSSPTPFLYLNTPCCDMPLTPYPQNFCWAPARIQMYESKFDGGHIFVPIYEDP